MPAGSMPGLRVLPIPVNFYRDLPAILPVAEALKPADKKLKTQKSREIT